MGIKIKNNDDYIYLKYEELEKIKDLVSKRLTNEIWEYYKSVKEIDGRLLDFARKKYIDQKQKLENKYGNDSKEIKILNFLLKTPNRGDYDSEICKAILDSLDDLDEDYEIGIMWNNKEKLTVNKFKEILKEMIGNKKRLVWF